MAIAARGKVGNLPLELTSFVGRRRELVEARRLLSVSRLVTLTGIGGVGKTRLALRVAEDSRRAFGDGVRLVELAEVHDPESLKDAVAIAVGLRVRAARPPLDMLVEYLSTRRLLLVMDNCEHLVEAVAVLCEALLRRCPELRILATSREPLGIGGEAVLRVPPLTVPDPLRAAPLEGLPQYEAVTLFVERATAALPEFRLTEENQGDVVGICRQLDGLPLPIELAAARLRAMSAAQILHRLTDRYRLLNKGSRSAPTRQQSLRACVDWSHELCSEQEQKLWRRLAVFAGSFELDAAEGICGEGFVEDELLDGVASLVDKSILIRDEPGAVVRYRLLETIRDYGQEKLRESGEHLAFVRRHRDWYERLALRAEDEWISPQQVEWIARLEREQSNLRDALTFSIAGDGEDAAAGLRMATALYPFWLSRGRLSEGRRWLDRALACPSAAETAERAKALYAYSALASMQGDVQGGMARLKEGRELELERHDAVSDAFITHVEGLLALAAGDFGRAVECLTAGLEVFRSEGMRLQIVEDLVGLGLATALLGDVKRAVAWHAEVLAITEPCGEAVFRTYSLWATGMAELQRGDPAHAIALFEEGLRLTRSVDDPLSAAWFLDVLAWIAAAAQEFERAATLRGAAMAMWQIVDGPTVRFPSLLVHRDECRLQIVGAIGERGYEAALRRGRALTFEGAVSFALREEPEADQAEPAVVDAMSLTRRERQVADLVAQGLTNKAIADQLVISPRTAQGHVEHVLAKLGFTSRTQIAAWFVERALDTQRGE
ncbi:ATP-binding protein [Rhodococcus daqingensis]|uniref:ATP-binding protein n=1 Tax=Rhodococcus daqingensis TaxID=2479363 RepID=A0ABW2S0E6_9NOCA